jgi:hypothetical protein
VEDVPVGLHAQLQSSSGGSDSISKVPYRGLVEPPWRWAAIFGDLRVAIQQPKNGALRNQHLRGTFDSAKAMRSPKTKPRELLRAFPRSLWGAALAVLGLDFAAKR